MPREIRFGRTAVVAAVVLVGSLSPALALGVATLLDIDPSSLQGNGFRMTATNIALLFAFAALTVGTALLAYRYLHRRPIQELRLRPVALRPLMWGHALGFLISGVLVVMRWSVASGSELTWAVPEHVSTGSLVAGYVFFIVAVVFLSSFKEELLYRAYPLTVGAARGSGVIPMLITSALIFAACHLILEPPTIAGFINRVCFGLLAGLVYLRSESIWAAIGLHNGWNWGLALVCGNWRMGGLWSLQLEALPEWTVALPTVLTIPIIGILAAAERQRSREVL